MFIMLLSSMNECMYVVMNFSSVLLNHWRRILFAKHCFAQSLEKNPLCKTGVVYAKYLFFGYIW